MEFFRSTDRNILLQAIRISIESLEYHLFTRSDIYTNRCIIVEKHNSVIIKLYLQVIESKLWFIIGYRKDNNGSLSDFKVSSQIIAKAALMADNKEYKEDQIDKIMEAMRTVIEEFIPENVEDNVPFGESICLYRIMRNGIDLLETDKKFNLSLYSARDVLESVFLENAKTFDFENNFDYIVKMTGIFASMIDESFLKFKINSYLDNGSSVQYIINIERLSVTGSPAIAVDIYGADGFKVIETSIVICGNDISKYFSKVHTIINEKVVYLQSLLKKITSRKDHKIICMSTISEDDLLSILP